MTLIKSTITSKLIDTPIGVYLVFTLVFTQIGIVFIEHEIKYIKYLTLSNLTYIL